MLPGALFDWIWILTAMVCAILTWRAAHMSLLDKVRIENAGLDGQDQRDATVMHWMAVRSAIAATIAFVGGGWRLLHPSSDPLHVDRAFIATLVVIVLLINKTYNTFRDLWLRQEQLEEKIERKKGAKQTRIGETNHDTFAEKRH